MPREGWDECNPDKQAIRTLIMKHRGEAAKLKKLMKYYEGQHKILTESRKNKLVCNHAKDIRVIQPAPILSGTQSLTRQADIKSPWML